MNGRPKSLAAIAGAVLLSVLFADGSAAADRLKVDFSKTPTSGGRGLEYEYRFTVTEAESGKQISGAKFEIATDMPSMPGAHHMPYVPAAPTDKPGEYSAKIKFDMAGVWTLILRFSEPRRDVVTLSDSIGGDDKKDTHPHGEPAHKRPRPATSQ